MQAADLIRLVEFWAAVTVLFGFMLFMAWWFKIGDVKMVRRTSIYFVAVFLVLPGLTLLLFKFSESLAKAIFVPALLLGTLVYLAFTVIAILRPKA
jgi:hypothetical protein